MAFIIMKMQVRYDKESDILYIVIAEGPAYDSKEFGEDIRLEYDKEGKVSGIEISDARKTVGKAMAEEIASHIKAISA